MHCFEEGKERKKNADWFHRNNKRTYTSKQKPLMISAPLIFGLNLRKVKGQMAISTDKEVVRNHETERIHGYKCKNLAESHNQRLQELERRLLQPHMPFRRVLHSNHNKYQPDRDVDHFKHLQNNKISADKRETEKAELEAGAKKRWRRISVFGQFTFGMLHASTDNRKLSLKPKKIRANDRPLSPHPDSVTDNVALPELKGVKQIGHRESIRVADLKSVISSPRRTRANTAIIQITPASDVIGIFSGKLAADESKTLSIPKHSANKLQRQECREIMNRFSVRGLDIDEKTLYRALVRPEEVSHDILRPNGKLKFKKVAAIN